MSNNRLCDVTQFYYKISKHYSFLHSKIAPSFTFKFLIFLLKQPVTCHLLRILQQYKVAARELGTLHIQLLFHLTNSNLVRQH